MKVRVVILSMLLVDQDRRLVPSETGLIMQADGMNKERLRPLKRTAAKQL
jgi:hypothetical protein